MSVEDVHAALRQRFAAQWATATPVQYESVAFSPPDKGPWARFVIRDSTAAWASFGAPGANTERGHGQVIVQIFTPAGTGEGEALSLARKAKGVYHGYEDAAVKLSFPQPAHLTQVGVDGKWYQINVHAPYQYDLFS